MLIDADALSIFSVNLCIFMAMNFSHFAYLNLKYKDKLPETFISFTNTFIDFHCYLFILFNAILINAEPNLFLYISFFLIPCFSFIYKNVKNIKYTKYSLFAMLISIVLYNFSISTFYGIMHCLVLLLMIFAANIFMFTSESLNKN